ncbi:MAG: phosphate ABC transporter permease subunit PstC [Phycisphaerae bacterium]|nr:phosphate ABC transporter permease subunit PstC [Phycisphaerae bacterium]
MRNLRRGSAGAGGPAAGCVRPAARSLPVGEPNSVDSGDINAKLDLTEPIRPGAERVVRWLVFVCAVLTVLITGGIVVVLLVNAFGFFADIPVWEFLSGTRWSPAIQPAEFGVLPLISGTLVITVGSAAIALPLGVAAAVYLSEYARPGIRKVLKPLLEILAGVPTVVYGYLALVYITPALARIFPTISTFNALSASIVVGIMIIPLVASISEDAMRAVPHSLRMASYGLGASKFSTIVRVVIPAAFSGIVASFILALSRAIGETMAVTIAAGQNPKLLSLLNLDETMLGPIETMTAAMVNIGTSELEGEATAYKSLFAIGLTLFCITFLMNIIGALVTSRYKEQYE